MSHHRTCLVSLSLFACLLLAPAPGHAAQSLDSCVGYIDSLPATISTQGVWCLRHDLSTAITSGNAIDIAANNVTIDCNDFKLGGLAGGTETQATGIGANNLLNITVRHCNVRGFRYGVFLGGLSGGAHVVEDNRLDNNQYVGLRVEGDGSVVRRNRINNTGGTEQQPIGIFTNAAVDVIDNTVSGVVAAYNAIGISLNGDTNASISGNRIRGLFTGASGATRGIFSRDSGSFSLKNNDISSGIYFSQSVGLTCPNNTGRASDNIVNGFATGNEGCIDAGGNSF